MSIVSRSLVLIYLAALFRSVAIGVLGVVLGLYLHRLGFSATQIGIVIGAGLAGAAIGLWLVSSRGDRVGRRRTLVALSLLSAIGGVGLALTTEFYLLMALAFFTMLNAMGTDRTAAFALEQAMIPELVNDEQRTWALSFYNLILDIGHGLGAAGATTPALLQHTTELSLVEAYQVIFIAVAALNLASTAVYLFLSGKVEVARPATLAHPEAISPRSRATVRRLAGLSAVDSLGGGFLTDALLAYWFFRRFGVEEQILGPLFAAAHILNAISYLVAAWLARRIGLLNTMVFTHLPSSAFLIAVPFAPTFAVAAAVFLAREALVEMDVPTRQSYIVAVVQPHERTYASGLTNLTRNVSWATASSAAGSLMQYVGLSAPLFLAGALKITYDLTLYRLFRKTKPPEESPVFGPEHKPARRRSR